MRKKLIRKKIKMFTAIISVFLIISIVVSGIYVYITFQSEKEILCNAAQKKFQKITQAVSDDIMIDGMFLNFYEAVNNDRTEQTQAILTKGDKVVEAENVLAVEFGSQFGTNGGFIHFDMFRDTMTDEQYDEITKYLTSSKRSDGKYYELICSEFYIYEVEDIVDYLYTIDNDKVYVTNTVRGKEIYPKTVQIVLTESSNDWNIQDEVIKTYKFTPNPTANYSLRMSGDMYRNVIDTNFVLGKYEKCDLIGELESKIGLGWNKNPNKDLFKIDTFTYTYYDYEVFYDYVYTEDGEAVQAIEKTELQYAEKFNVLEHCIDRIGLIFVYTLILFLMSGIIVALMSWRTVKNQMKLEEKRRDMINSMAHDLKTPLFIISGYAENLIECVKTSEEREYANSIVEQANSMNEMIYTMLDLSRLNADDYSLSMEEFSLSDLVSEILLNYNNFYEEYILGYSCDCDATITGDKKLLECVIRNFIENSLKYTDDKNSINIELEEHKFTISNSVSKETEIDIKHIWEPEKYSRKNENKTGNGLGLSLAKSVLDMHKFKYSAELSNSTITFTFEF